MSDARLAEAHGIHLIPLPLDDRRTVNAILVEGEPLTLVDTGLGEPASLAALQAGLARLGYAVRDLAQIVVTHAHLDHFGAAAALMRASGASVMGDAGGAEQMTDFARFWPASQAYRLALFQEAGAPPALLDASRRWGDHYAQQGEPVHLTRGLAGGDRVVMGGATWEVIEVPGHAASSIALYEPVRGLLLSGDILLGSGSASVTLHQVGDGRLPAGWQLTILESLERLARLPLRVVWPGHGPRLDDPITALRDRRERVEARLSQVRDLLRRRPLTAYELAQTLYRPPVATSGLGLSQALGYLDALEGRGEAEAVIADGLRRYRPRG